MGVALCSQGYFRMVAHSAHTRIHNRILLVDRILHSALQDVPFRSFQTTIHPTTNRRPPACSALPYSKLTLYLRICLSRLVYCLLKAPEKQWRSHEMARLSAAVGTQARPSCFGHLDLGRPTAVSGVMERTFRPWTITLRVHP